MFHGTIVLVTATALTGTPATTQLRKSGSLCRAGRYKEGFDLAVQAGLKGTGRWRPVARRCLEAWIRSLGRACRPTRDLPRNLAQLRQVEKLAAKLAMTPVARRAVQVRQRCLAGLPKKIVAACKSEPGPGSLKLAQRLAALAPDRKAAAHALEQCSLAWADNIDLRCRVHPTLRLLDEASQAVRMAPSGAKARAKATYEQCARTAIRFGLAACDAGRYLEGRHLAREALIRFPVHGARDPAYEAKTKKAILERCGRFLLLLDGQLAATTPQIAVTFALKGYLLLTGPDQALRGSLTVLPRVVAASAPKAHVLVRPHKCVFPLRGRYNPKTGNVAWYPRTSKATCTETIQITPSHGAAKVLRETILADTLAAAKVLKSWTSASEGSELGISYQGPIGGQRQVTLKGKLEVRKLEPVP